MISADSSSVVRSMIDLKMPQFLRNFNEENTFSEKVLFVFSSYIAARYILEQEIMRRNIGLSCLIFSLKSGIYDPTQRKMAKNETELEHLRNVEKLPELIERHKKLNDEVKIIIENLQELSEQRKQMKIENEKQKAINESLKETNQEIKNSTHHLRNEIKKRVAELEAANKQLNSTTAQQKTLFQRVCEMQDLSGMESLEKPNKEGPQADTPAAAASFVSRIFPIGTPASSPQKTRTLEMSPA